jgi:hypothetical protein
MNDLIIENSGVIDLGAFTSPENYEIAVRDSLLNENVDSLLVGFACVGDCDVEQYSAAIRRGVNSAEEKTNIEKPVLLCLMGATGTVSLADDSSHKNLDRKFPTFRFPESAVNALGKIVRYIDFRKQPLGNLVWYEDVKADEARRLIHSIISKDTSQQEIIDLDKSTDAEMLVKYFGIQTIDIKPGLSDIYKIKVKPDTLFGPLLEVKAQNSQPILRITPLTNRDLEEIMKELKLEKESGIGQVLGRISQMIEEIPWIWNLEVQAIKDSIPLIIQDVYLSIKPGGVERPTY